MKIRVKLRVNLNLKVNLALVIFFCRSDSYESVDAQSWQSKKKLLACFVSTQNTRNLLHHSQKSLFSLQYTVFDTYVRKTRCHRTDNRHHQFLPFLIPIFPNPLIFIATYATMIF